MTDAASNPVLRTARVHLQKQSQKVAATCPQGAVVDDLHWFQPRAGDSPGPPAEAVSERWPRLVPKARLSTADTGSNPVLRTARGHLRKQSFLLGYRLLAIGYFAATF